MVRVGIDLGGTNIVAGVVDDSYTILATAKRKTNLPRPAEEIIRDMAELTREAVEKANMTMNEVRYVGVGCPGTCNQDTGIVEYSNNLQFHKVPLRDDLSRLTGKPVYIENDANAAALGEVVAGCAQNVDSAVILTLGTGVGSGVVLNGKILTGCTGGAAELGHMVVEDGGALCACGRKGCFETYASATGLIRMAKEAMAQHPESLLHATAAEVGDVNGQTIFRAKEQGDPTAVAVVERYIHYLSVGIANVINCFFPEVVALSGGIANQGEALLAPLREAVAPQVYGNQYLQTHTRILGCTLGYHAGIIGAAMLPTAL